MYASGNACGSLRMDVSCAGGRAGHADHEQHLSHGRSLSIFSLFPTPTPHACLGVGAPAFCTHHPVPVLAHRRVLGTGKIRVNWGKAGVGKGARPIGATFVTRMPCCQSLIRRSRACARNDSMRCWMRATGTLGDEETHQHITHRSEPLHANHAGGSGPGSTHVS